jgi:DUF4097 and DUF4098 domain-containing protein YvlB
LDDAVFRGGNSVTIHRQHALSSLALRAVATAAGILLASCQSGPAVTGAFDRDFSATGHTRLELVNASGDVEITGSADGKIHVHGDVRATGMGFDKPKERLAETLANPGVEQKGDTIRIGKHVSNFRNISITYKIEVPHDTEVNANVVSGSQTIRNVRGPIAAQSASGSINVAGVERDAHLTTVSGSVEANGVGDDVRASSASGSVAINNAKGDVRANTLSGAIRIQKPAGRVDADDASGAIEIFGASGDVKAHDVSVSVTVQGDPGEHGYWDLKTVSGKVQLHVPANSSFRLAAEAISGEIRADIPIVIEEQGKHSLRAHIGNGGGRVEVHTVSGEIQVSGAN